MATTTFTDQVGANLDQCQNDTLAFLSDPCGTAPANAHPNWSNGDVNGSNSQYREGDGLPYRNAITGLTNGTWTIRVEYDFTKGGVPAIDRLTRYNLTQASNPCLSTNQVTCTVASPADSFTAPSEVVSPSATQPALPNTGNVHTWNGLASVLLSTKGLDAANMHVWSDGCSADVQTAGQNWTGNQGTSFTDGKVLQTGSAASDSKRQFAFKVLVSGCPSGQGGNLMMGWTGHIASHLDWGVGKGAGSISGAPFHMRILGVDNAQGTSGGNQDRSVQLSAIVQTLEVRKVLSPVGSGTFDLQIDSGDVKAAAVGDGGTTGPVAVDAGNHSVSELGAGGTNLASFSSSIACVDSSGNPVASNSGSASLGRVNVPIGDSVVCTITNTLLKSHLTLVKQVINDNGGTAEADDWTLNAAGPTPISGASGSAAVTNAEVNSGNYALSESNRPVRVYGERRTVCATAVPRTCSNDHACPGSGRDLHDHQQRQRAEADSCARSS